jgi:hypothetical protein
VRTRYWVALLFGLGIASVSAAVLFVGCSSYSKQSAPPPLAAKGPSGPSEAEQPGVSVTVDHLSKTSGVSSNRMILNGGGGIPNRPTQGIVVNGGLQGWGFGSQAAKSGGGALPARSLSEMEDEIWVIARAPEGEAPAGEEGPGTGSMLAKLPGEEKEVPIPLKHTDVKAVVGGYIESVQVTQQFHNPYDQKIEAVYVFPLPHNSAVSEFVMTVGDRKIRGIIREREEAQKIYDEAKRQGYVASLLTQERPNVFTQRVANIEPGKQIDVNITYYGTLAYVDGWYEFVFPMVLGPRERRTRTSRPRRRAYRSR